MNVSSSVFAVLKIGTTICGITFFSSLSLFKWKLLTIRITVACGVFYRMIFYRMQKSEFLCNASRTIAAKKNHNAQQSMRVVQVLYNPWYLMHGLSPAYRLGNGTNQPVPLVFAFFVLLLELQRSPKQVTSSLFPKEITRMNTGFK